VLCDQKINYYKSVTVNLLWEARFHCALNYGKGSISAIPIGAGMAVIIDKMSVC